MGSRSETDDGTVDGPATTSVIPVLGPVFLDGATGLANILEVGATEILVLLDVEPKVENVFCTFAL